MRPKTLTVSLVPVLVGSALAWSQTHVFHGLPALVALLAAVLIQIGTNLYNDVSDFERGADTPERLGPPRATAMGWLPADAVRRAAWIAFGLAFNFGVYLAWYGGWPIVATGLSSLLAGWAYTGGPRPIAYTPFGEVFVWLFFGLAAVGGSYYLQTLSIDAAALLAAAIVGLLAAGVITVNNYRDLESDARAGKRTLAVFLGRRGTKILYALEMLLPFLLLPVLAVLTGRGAWLLLPVLILPLVLAQVGRFRRETPGRVFNELLARTARLQFAFGLLLALALIV
jgi:1,4-dihydroxy-2-naphthoate octaprenyltransferase